MLTVLSDPSVFLLSRVDYVIGLPIDFEDKFYLNFSLLLMKISVFNLVFLFFEDPTHNIIALFSLFASLILLILITDKQFHD